MPETCLNHIKTTRTSNERRAPRQGSPVLELARSLIQLFDPGRAKPKPDDAQVSHRDLDLESRKEPEDTFCGVHPKAPPVFDVNMI